jgi:hypothetical protein
MNKVSISQQWAEKEGKDQTKVEVPHQFQQHKMVFSKEVAKCFPPLRPEDHIIKLREDAPQTINCKTYKLTIDKREAMVSFLKDQQDKKYMTRSNSPWSSPFFYIKKKAAKDDQYMIIGKSINGPSLTCTPYLESTSYSTK